MPLALIMFCHSEDLLRETKFIGQTTETLEPKQDTATIFCSADLDLNPMTFIHENDLDILEMYLHANSEVSRSIRSKVRA